jgi:hypothetical protein
MKVFKQSYEARLSGGEFECSIVLENVKKISFNDIVNLTGGILPYAIKFCYTYGKHSCCFVYYQTGGIYKAHDDKVIRIPYGKGVTGKVTLQGCSQDCMDNFGVVNVEDAVSDKIVLYGVKSFWSYIFDSNKESAVSTHKITITPKGYEIAGLGADRYCRVLDKASEFYGKLFSEVEDKEYLMQYYWKYRKKRCIDMDALARVLGQSKMGGTSWEYTPKYICED